MGKKQQGIGNKYVIHLQHSAGVQRSTYCFANAFQLSEHGVLNDFGVSASLFVIADS